MLMVVSTTGTIGYVKMRGRDVFRHAVEKLASAMDEVLELANLTSDDIDWLVLIRQILESLMQCKKT